MYNSIEMIDQIIVRLNDLSAKGIDNMVVVIDVVQRLSALKKGLEDEQKAREEVCCEQDNYIPAEELPS